MTWRNREVVFSTDKEKQIKEFLASWAAKNRLNWYETVREVRILANRILNDGELVCEMCGKKIVEYDDMNQPIPNAYHIHHIRPRQMGGTDNPSNLTLVCVECHKKLPKD
jgi:predicted HNH restriction endonuclease